MGTLPSPKQREDRAKQILGTALALAMRENGWLLQVRPGTFYQWIEQRRELGIAQMLISPAPGVTHAAEEKSPA